MDLARAVALAKDNQRSVLVTLKRDGRPQLSNVVHAVGDDGLIRVSITDARAKTANIRRDGRVSLYIPRDDLWAYLVIEGDGELSAVATSPDGATVDELITLYRAMQGEHPDWDDYRRAMVADRRLVLRMTPTYAYGAWPAS